MKLFNSNLIYNATFFFACLKFSAPVSLQSRSKVRTLIRPITIQITQVLINTMRTYNQKVMNNIIVEFNAKPTSFGSSDLGGTARMLSSSVIWTIRKPFDRTQNRNLALGSDLTFFKYLMIRSLFWAVIVELF